MKGIYPFLLSIQLLRAQQPQNLLRSSETKKAQNFKVIKAQNFAKHQICWCSSVNICCKFHRCSKTMMRCNMLHAPRALDYHPTVTKQYHMSSQP